MFDCIIIVVPNAIGKFHLKTDLIKNISPGGLVHYRSSITLDSVLQASGKGTVQKL